MVTITGYAIRQRQDGSSFVSLELTGSVELIQSQNTGRYYATVRKVSIPSTFNEHVAASIVGQKLEGEIIRVQCDPYEFTSKSTGEVMTLSHSWAYRPQGAMELIGEEKVKEVHAALS